MKMTEFYEKYWTVDGKPVPPLSPSEKIIWDIAEELACNPYIRVWRRSFGWVTIINPLIQEVLDSEKKIRIKWHAVRQNELRQLKEKYNK